MARNWYNKRDIRDRFSWSFKQFKNRLTYLEPTLNGHTQGGNGVAYQVDDYGLSLLERQYQLEQEGYGVKEASRLIAKELENGDNKGNSDGFKVGQGALKVKIEALERENNLLRDQLAVKDRRIDRLEQRIDGLLTGQTLDKKGILRRILDRLW